MFCANSRCRREDSNLHTLNGYQVLNLARLPIPPLRQRTALAGHRETALHFELLFFVLLPPQPRQGLGKSWSLRVGFGAGREWPANDIRLLTVKMLRDQLASFLSATLSYLYFAAEIT